MADRSGAVGSEETVEQAPLPAVKRRRFPIPIIIASVIMFFALAVYFANGIFLLIDLGLFGTGRGVAATMAGALTPEGRQMILGAVFLFFGVVALAIEVGFILRQKWAWSGAMTWTAITLLAYLIAYFIGEPVYPGMLVGLVLLLVLNLAEVHREFRIE